jgi:phage shock protein PspC (stress-responsive transcriptional regulator)
MENSSRLYRSVNDKTIGGVCGGLADYFNIDVVLIRVAFVLLLLFGGGGFLAYIVLWIVIPQQPMDFTAAGNSTKNDSTTDKNTITGTEKKKNNTSMIAGIVLILIGLIILFDRVIPYYDIIDFWPAILIFLGIMIIKPGLFNSTNNENEMGQVTVNETEETAQEANNNTTT